MIVHGLRGWRAKKKKIRLKSHVRYIRNIYKLNETILDTR